MRATDLVNQYRANINPPYKRKDLVSILGTVFILLAIPLTVFVAVKVRPWGPRAAGTAAAPTTIGSVVEPGSMVSGASYIVFVDGTNYYARNGKTGEIQFSGTGDATPVIQAAIDALPAGGGKIVLTEGTFTLGSTVVPSEKGCTIEGQGYSTLIQYNSNSVSHAFGHTNGSLWRTIEDATFRNIRIKNTGSVSSTSISIGWQDHIPQRITIDHVEAENGSLWITCGAHHRVEHSYVHDLKSGTSETDTGITIRGAGEAAEPAPCWATDSIIANNIIKSVPEMGIAVGGVDGIIVADNKIDDAAQTADPKLQGFAIDAGEATNANISGNNIKSQKGILFENADAGTVQIVDNIVKGIGPGSGDGIKVWRTAAAKPQTDRVLISGNTVHNVFFGINVADEDRVSIVDNLVDNVGGTGIGVSKAGVSKDFPTGGIDPHDVLIQGNTVSRWSANDAYQPGISANVANAKVSDNYLDGGSLNNNRGIAGLRNLGWITDNVIQNVVNEKMFEIEAGVILEHNY